MQERFVVVTHLLTWRVAGVVSTARIPVCTVTEGLHADGIKWGGEGYTCVEVNQIALTVIQQARLKLFNALVNSVHSITDCTMDIIIYVDISRYT
jgi:hypothetical protein